MMKSGQNKPFFPEDLPRFSGEACKDALFSHQKECFCCSSRRRWEKTVALEQQRGKRNSRFYATFLNIKSNIIS